MALLLTIDTATEHASVCLAKDGTVLQLEESHEQKNHASFVQPAISSLLKKTGHSIRDVDAIAVTSGPGSYTGLRVGLASAKGLCFALNKPLILLNTLEVMAVASIEEIIERQLQDTILFCPVIDARRMELFTAMYDKDLHVCLPPLAIICDEHSFSEQLNQHPVVFSGSGSAKLGKVLHHPNVIFSSVQHNASHMVILSERCFTGRVFADIAYCEPFYLKEFFDTAKKRTAGNGIV